MTGEYYDRFGEPMPDDWYDKTKYKQSKWETSQRVATTTNIDDKWTVSTVWLGINHNHGAGPPLIFETMVFGDTWSYEMDRYSTEEQAMRGHLRVVDALRAGLPPFPHCEVEDEA